MTKNVSFATGMDLTITLLPFVDAGSDEEICEGATLDLAASGTTPIASNTSSLSWTTAGDGSFDVDATVSTIKVELSAVQGGVANAISYP